MSEKHWFSFTKPDGTGIGISPVPGRKRICLYFVEPGEYMPLAYFVNEEAAMKMQAWLLKHFNASARRNPE